MIPLKYIPVLMIWELHVCCAYRVNHFTMTRGIAGGLVQLMKTKGYTFPSLKSVLLSGQIFSYQFRKQLSQAMNVIAYVCTVKLSYSIYIMYVHRSLWFVACTYYRCYLPCLSLQTCYGSSEQLYHGGVSISQNKQAEEQRYQGIMKVKRCTEVCVKC